MEENKYLWKPATVGKLAIRLARRAYFGDSVLMASTVTGNGKPALDDKKLNLLYGDVHNNVFKSTSAECFNKHNYSTNNEQSNCRSVQAFEKSLMTVFTFYVNCYLFCVVPQNLAF